MDKSKVYEQLSYCNKILSDIHGEQKNDMISIMHYGGWKFDTYSLEKSGIDPDKVYKYIEGLVHDKIKHLYGLEEKLIPDIPDDYL